jgi:hypothetical protein
VLDLIGMDRADGKLDILLYLRDARVALVNIHSTQTADIPKQLNSVPVQDALARLPLLYAASPYGHRIAAERAAESALDVKQGEEYEMAQELLLCAETASEYLLGVFSGWGSLLGEKVPPSVRDFADTFAERIDTMLFAAVKKSFDSGLLAKEIGRLEEILQAKLLGMMPEQWLAIDEQDQLMSWVLEGRSLGARLIGWVIAKEWEHEFQTGIPFLAEDEIPSIERTLQSAYADSFINSPDIDGSCRETGCYSRRHDTAPVPLACKMYGHGLIPRLLAVMTELAAIPAYMRSQMDRLSNPIERAILPVDKDGAGMAVVETAGGKLLHRLDIAEGTVRNYQIVIPGEWNFHRRGVLPQVLTSMDYSDDLNLFTTLLVGTLDPGVEFELRTSSTAPP